MEKIDWLLLRLGAKYESKRYVCLRCMLEVALKHWPERISMKQLQVEVAERIGNNMPPSGLSRATARAVLDIWEYGDREFLNEIYQRNLSDCPTPKNFIYVVTCYLYASGRRVGKQGIADNV